MKKCPKCGTQNQSNARFCVKCGYNFADDSHNNGIHCPNCGRVNRIGAKFCKHCGQPLNSQPERQQGYDRQWQQANQSFVKVSSYSTNYFSWLKRTLVHPLSKDTSNPYFGATSLVITAILLWIAEVLSKDSYKLFNQTTHVFGYIPTSGYFNAINNSNFKKPLWLLILTLLTIVVYWAASYVGNDIATHHPQNIFVICNRLAGVTNIAMIASALAIGSVLLESSVLTWLLIDAVGDIFLAGLFYTVVSSAKGFKTPYSSIYIAMASCLACNVIQGLLVIMVGGLIN